MAPEKVKLIFLNGCSNYEQAQHLLEAGVPNVMVTHRAIEDKVAVTFAVAFYKELAAGKTADEAFIKAEAVIKTEGIGPEACYKRELYTLDNPPDTTTFPWKLLSAPDAGKWRLFDRDLKPTWLARHLQHPQHPHFSGRETELQTLAQTLADKNTVNIHAVSGMGGIGKTQLASEYAYRYGGDYSVVWWLRCEQEIDLLNDMVALADVLLPEYKELEATEKQQRLLHWLNRHDSWLLIYDNAERLKEIAPYVPKGTGHTLITSRRDAWGGQAETLRLGVWKGEETIAFLQKRLGDVEGVEVLAERLGDLPLALAHAAAYIASIECTVADYIAYFEQEYEDLKETTPDLDLYEHTIYTTWQISIKVAEEAKNGQGAQAFLTLCAYLAPEGIPREMFTKHHEVLPEPLQEVCAKKIKLNALLGTLNTYSLIELDQETLSIHRLLQDIVRAELPEQEQQAWAEASLMLLCYAFDYDYRDVHNPEVSEMAPHAQAVIRHTKTWEVGLREKRYLYDQYGSYLARKLARYEEAEGIYRESITIAERTIGKEHPSYAAHLNNLAGVLARMGRYEEAEGIYRESITIAERTIGKEHPSYAVSLNNLANLFISTERYVEAEPLLGEAVRIMRKQLGEGHPRTQQVMQNYTTLQQMLL